MRCIWMVGLLAACTSAPVGDPQIELTGGDGPFTYSFVGEPVQGSVSWPGEAHQQCHKDLLGDESCSEYHDATPFQIDAVTCDGCQVSGLSPGQSISASQSFTMVATDTTPIRLDVTVESGGDVRHVVATSTGDREVGVYADCMVIWTSQLRGDWNSTPMHACGATRRPDETVLLFPGIYTVHAGQLSAPDFRHGDTPHPRQVQLQPAPAGMFWETYAYSDPCIDQVIVSVPLLDGTVATATVKVPSGASPTYSKCSSLAREQ